MSANYCKVCKKHANTHVGVAKACFGGYGTVFIPDDCPTCGTITDPNPFAFVQCPTCKHLVNPPLLEQS